MDNNIDMEEPGRAAEPELLNVIVPASVCWICPRGTFYPRSERPSKDPKAAEKARLVEERRKSNENIMRSFRMK